MKDDFVSAPHSRAHVHSAITATMPRPLQFDLESAPSLEPLQSRYLLTVDNGGMSWFGMSVRFIAPLSRFPLSPAIASRKAPGLYQP